MGVATTAVARHVDPLRPVVLDEGKLKHYRWGVTVARDDGVDGGQKPCVASSLLDLKPKGYPPGLVNETFLKVCSVLDLRMPPNIVSVAFGKGSSEVTVFGIAFVPSVTAIQLDFGAKGRRKLRLRLLMPNRCRSQVFAKYATSPSQLPAQFACAK